MQQKEQQACLRARLAMPPKFRIRRHACNVRRIINPRRCNSYDSRRLLTWSLPELRVAAAIARGVRQNGAHQRAARCPQDHVQRREAWKASSTDQTLLKSGYQVLASHDEAR